MKKDTLNNSLYWLAGVIDGEGCFTIERSIDNRDKTIRFYPKILITNTAEVLLNKVKTILKHIRVPHFCTKYHRKQNKDGYHRKICYDIQIHRYSEIVKLISYIQDKLVLKKEQAILMKQYCQHRIAKRTKVTRNADAKYTEFEYNIYKKFINLHGRRG